MIEITQNSKLKSQSYSLNLKTNLKHRTYNFSIEIIKSIDSLPNTVASKVIVKQLIRAATSVGANIIEAKSSSSRKDFVNFYNHALKSANETKYWLCLLRDACGFNNNKVMFLISEISEIANMLGSSILTLKEKNKF